MPPGCHNKRVACGFTVTRHTAVGDKLEDLIALLQDIAQRADCCICTGGLGPTSDDLTAEAVALAFNMPLAFDEIAFEHISRFFANRNRTMPASNRKQAMLPQGAERIDNEWGTAPGFSLKFGRCWFAFLPGVPMEMKHLFQERILPTLSDRFSLRPGQLVTIKTLGLRRIRHSGTYKINRNTRAGAVGFSCRSRRSANQVIVSV